VVEVFECRLALGQPKEAASDGLAQPLEGQFELDLEEVEALRLVRRETLTEFRERLVANVVGVRKPNWHVTLKHCFTTISKEAEQTCDLSLVALPSCIAD